MDIKFIKREELQENRIRRNLVSANISLITCSLWTMMKELAGMTQPFVRTDQLR